MELYWYITTNQINRNIKWIVDDNINNQMIVDVPVETSDQHWLQMTWLHKTGLHLQHYSNSNLPLANFMERNSNVICSLCIMAANTTDNQVLACEPALCWNRTVIKIIQKTNEWHMNNTNINIWAALNP